MSACEKLSDNPGPFRMIDDEASASSAEASTNPFRRKRLGRSHIKVKVKERGILDRTRSGTSLIQCNESDAVKTERVDGRVGANLMVQAGSVGSLNVGGFE